MRIHGQYGLSQREKENASSCLVSYSGQRFEPCSGLCDGKLAQKIERKVAPQLFDFIEELFDSEPFDLRQSPHSDCVRDGRRVCRGNVFPPRECPFKRKECPARVDIRRILRKDGLYQRGDRIAAGMPVFGAVSQGEAGYDYPNCLCDASRGFALHGYNLSHNDCRPQTPYSVSLDAPESVIFLALDLASGI
jgi:hypothetical protein